MLHNSFNDTGKILYESFKVTLPILIRIKLLLGSIIVLMSSRLIEEVEFIYSSKPL